MTECRMKFEKTGRAVYISHLDLMRTMQRSFLRAGVHIRHTEGFNPHPHMVFALPLPVGCAGKCELVDFSVLENVDPEKFPEQVNPFLPEGMRAIEVYAPARKFKEIAWIRTGGLLSFRNGTVPNADALRELWNREEVRVMKKTKRGMEEINLIPYVKNPTFTPSEDGIIFNGCVCAQEPSINPELITSAIRAYVPESAPSLAEYCREALLDKEFTEFR